MKWKYTFLRKINFKDVKYFICTMLTNNNYQMKGVTGRQKAFLIKQ